MKSTSLIFACLFLVIPCQAETIIVDPNGSADFTNIQDAINYSWDGDTVIVRPSTYNEAIKFNGRRITLTGLNPDDEGIVDSTVIIASSGPAVTFDFSEDSNSVITGFTITGYGSTGNGHGVYCYAASPTIAKNIIRDCDYSGIRGKYNASPTISNNKIIDNGHSIGNSTSGSGIVGCDGLISNNIISGNWTKSGSGAGLASCDGIITNNVISQNERKSSGSSNGGGGLANCDGTIINNTIVSNNSIAYGEGYGGGIFKCYGVIKNNIIAYNSAITGGGIYSEGPCDNSYNAFWGNTNGNFGGVATAGTGDFIRDPLFAGSIYHLQSTAGRYDPGTDTWVLDDANSPCIDAGDPSDDIGLEPNPNGGRINIGAYGGTSQASKSPSGIVLTVCTEYPAMDFNKDCKVDFEDFALFTQSWLECNLDPPEACWE
ncbi:MAG: hypothetical protein FVQ85_16485 [Planctomycetes bacterium]|nr:hypothetical protein [Planctomycetota bacterium]